MAMWKLLWSLWSSPYYSSFSFLCFLPIGIIYSYVSQVLIKAQVVKELLQLWPNNNNTAAHTVHGSKEKQKQQRPPQQQQQQKKVAIVTGSNTGIGFCTAKCLANRYGYTVILACRSESKARAAATEIGSNAVFLCPLDLSSFQSVYDFCQAVQKKYSKIHLLINNAGRNTTGLSSDGLDLQFQTNFLGHFLLTQQLLEQNILEKNNYSNGGTRIVNLASVMHHFCWPCSTIGTVQFWKDIALADHTSSWKVCGMPVFANNSYMLSKLAAILFTRELNRRYPNVSCIAVNPGVVNSDIWRRLPGLVRGLVAIFSLTTEQGSHTSIVAATTTDTHETYLQPYWMPSYVQDSVPFPILEMHGPFVGSRATTPRLPPDADAAGKALWLASEQLITEWTKKKEQ